MQRITAADYVEWAVGMLVEGRDSPSLRIFAGLDERGGVFEAEDYFVRVMRELQISEPDSAAALKAYGVDLATKILDGSLGPEAGVRMLYQLCKKTNYEAPFTVWCELDDALDDIKAGSYPNCYEKATAENFGDIVKKEARKFIERVSS